MAVPLFFLLPWVMMGYVKQQQPEVGKCEGKSKRSEKLTLILPNVQSEPKQAVFYCPDARILVK